jgi:hypothetical protein
MNINQAFLNALTIWEDFYEYYPYRLGIDDETGVMFVNFEKDFLKILDSEMMRPITTDEMREFVKKVLSEMVMEGIYNDQY